MKKVLLSAYACEPNKGSEPGVGWNWALEIERLGHKVWVLTRKNNQAVIEDYWKVNSKPKNLNFIYSDVPKWLSWWKKGSRGVHLYYLLWQFVAYLKARGEHKELKFDQVQHITFVTVRQPSFMGLLGIPFIFGPVGGGEHAPYRLRKGFSRHGKVKDFLRDVVNYLVKFDPFMYITFSTANEIYTTSEQSKALLPSFFRGKAKVQLAIGFDGQSAEQTTLKKPKDHLNLLYVGRFEYWKGMGLGLQAFAQHLKLQPNTTLTMVGKGPDKVHWQALSKKLGIDNKINWIEWIEQRELRTLYQEHDVFLFPSLHDSGGMVVLEAMSQGLPTICLDLGGPAVMVDDTCGIKINVENLNEKQVIDELRQAILELAKNDHLIKSLSNGAVAKAKAMSWAAIVKNVYSVSLP